MTSLEQHLTDHEYLDTFDGWESCECGWREEIERRSETGSVFTHAAHVADAWRESRTVRTVDELDALPDRSIIRAEKERGPRTGATYFEKLWRGKWLNLDPSDRYDGEESLDSDLIIKWFAKGGQCRILWTPEDGAK